MEQTLRPQEAEGVGPALPGCGCLRNLAVGLQVGGDSQQLGRLLLAVTGRVRAAVTSLSI